MKSNPLKERGFVVGDYSPDNYKIEHIDLHRPYVDDIVLVNDAGEPMRREDDLIDVWFDSGSMPYAQLHYPFEGEICKDGLAKTGLTEDEYRKQLISSSYSGTAVPPAFYPADFINEGVDQTRGWFFTLHAIATMVRGTNSYKAVISNGSCSIRMGNKMSKRLGNAVDPFETIEKYGSDPLRWYMISNSSPWDNLKFDVEGIDEVRRKFFATLYNTYQFFALYANLDGFDPTAREELPYAERPEIDRWILSTLNSLILEVDSDLEDYEPTRCRSCYR